MVRSLILTQHLLIRLGEREIPIAWVERVALAPAWKEPDPHDRNVTRAFGRIQEAEGKVLRVAYVDRADGRHVLSAHFDAKETRRRRSCA
jgi:hypothetical protein